MNKIILIALIVALAYLSYQRGMYQANLNQKRLVRQTFAPVTDCIIQFHYSRNGEDIGVHWVISNYQLHNQDWEKNKDRQCEREVGDILHEFLITEDTI